MQMACYDRAETETPTADLPLALCPLFPVHKILQANARNFKNLNFRHKCIPGLSSIEGKLKGPLSRGPGLEKRLFQFLFDSHCFFQEVNSPDLT